MTLPHLSAAGKILVLGWHNLFVPGGSAPFLAGSRIAPYFTKIILTIFSTSARRLTYATLKKVHTLRLVTLKNRLRKEFQKIHSSTIVLDHMWAARRSNPHWFGLGDNNYAQIAIWVPGAKKSLLGFIWQCFKKIYQIRHIFFGHYHPVFPLIPPPAVPAARRNSYRGPTGRPGSCWQRTIPRWASAIPANGRID